MNRLNGATHIAALEDPGMKMLQVARSTPLITAVIVGHKYVTCLSQNTIVALHITPWHAWFCFMWDSIAFPDCLLPWREREINIEPVKSFSLLCLARYAHCLTSNNILTLLPSPGIMTKSRATQRYEISCLSFATRHWQPQS